MAMPDGVKWYRWTTKNTIINIEEGTEAVVEGLEDYLVAYRDHSLLVCRLHDEQQIKIWIEGLK